MAEEAMEEFRVTMDVVPEARSRATLRGHNEVRVIRKEDKQIAAVGLRCGARMYVDWRTSSLSKRMEGI